MKNLLKFLIFMLLFAVVPVVNAHHVPIDYIIDTDIGGDIDDVLTLLIALNEPNKPLAITTTHINPQEKARIAKLIMTVAGHPEIPVYAGIGTTRQDSSALFLEQNPLWPPVFGYPLPSPGEATWFAQQAVPYKEIYGPLFSEMNIEPESAPEYIAHLARKYSPQHPLVIVAIGPLHNIAAALKIAPEIRHNIQLYSMGGVYPKGYNWLVSPATTEPVLAQVETISVINTLIDEHQFYVMPDEFTAMEENTHSQLGRAIIQDWKNWYKIDAGNLKKTHLSDLVTLYLALHPEELSSMQTKEISFPCVDDNGILKPEYVGFWYNMPGLENKLMAVKDTEKSHVRFVTQVNSAAMIRKKMLEVINKYLSCTITHCI